MSKANQTKQATLSKANIQAILKIVSDERLADLVNAAALGSVGTYDLDAIMQKLFTAVKKDNPNSSTADLNQKVARVICVMSVASVFGPTSAKILAFAPDTVLKEYNSVKKYVVEFTKASPRATKLSALNPVRAAMLAPHLPLAVYMKKGANGYQFLLPGFSEDQMLESAMLIRPTLPASMGGKYGKKSRALALMTAGAWSGVYQKNPSEVEEKAATEIAKRTLAATNRQMTGELMMTPEQKKFLGKVLKYWKYDYESKSDLDITFDGVIAGLQRTSYTGPAIVTTAIVDEEEEEEDAGVGQVSDFDESDASDDEEME